MQGATLRGQRGEGRRAANGAQPDPELAHHERNGRATADTASPTHSRAQTAATNLNLKVPAHTAATKRPSGVCLALLATATVTALYALPNWLGRLHPGHFLPETSATALEAAGLGIDYSCSRQIMAGTFPYGYNLCLDADVVRDRFAERQCVVYSFGIAEEWSFDLTMASMGCEVHAFDPTVSRPSMKVADNLYFHAIGLGPAVVSGIQIGHNKNASTWTLESAMTQLGHNFVDLVKIDIEGAEWDTLGAVVSTTPQVLDHVGLLDLDMHFGMGPHSDTMTTEERVNPVLSFLRDNEWGMYYHREGTRTSEYAELNGQGMHNLHDTSWINTRVGTIEAGVPRWGK